MRCLSRIAVAFGIWLVIAGCAVRAYHGQTVQPDRGEPVHGDSGGGSGGGGSM